MALNWTMLENGKPVPLPGERFINVFENADLSVLAIGDLPNLRKNGIIYVSPQRVCVLVHETETSTE